MFVALLGPLLVAVIVYTMFWPSIGLALSTVLVMAMSADTDTVAVTLGD